MTVFLVIVLIVGNLLLISGSVFTDLADNSIAWFIVIGAIAMDCYFIYKTIQGVSEGNKQKRITEAIKRTNEIISSNTPAHLPSLQATKELNVENSLINSEVVITVKELKKNLATLLSQCHNINTRLNGLLACVGYTTEIEKLEYLNSKFEEITQLKRESDNLYKIISKHKIELLNEDGDLLLYLKTTFASLLKSKKCITNKVEIKEFLCDQHPVDLSLFRYKYPPVIFKLDGFYYCLFSNVILVFDSNGVFSTALDPTALSITTEKHTENVLISNGTFVRQEFTDVDSKLIKQGVARQTWTYTRNDGLPDRRYTYNPRIEYRTNEYEYCIINISILSVSISFTVSSENSSKRFDSISQRYIRKFNNLHNSIPDLMLLLKSVIGEETAAIEELICATNVTENTNNYFCRYTDD